MLVVVIVLQLRTGKNIRNSHEPSNHAINDDNVEVDEKHYQQKHVTKNLDNDTTFLTTEEAHIVLILMIIVLLLFPIPL